MLRSSLYPRNDPSAKRASAKRGNSKSLRPRVTRSSRSFTKGRRRRRKKRRKVIRLAYANGKEWAGEERAADSDSDDDWVPCPTAGPALHSFSALRRSKEYVHPPASVLVNPDPAPSQEHMSESYDRYIEQSGPS